MSAVMFSSVPAVVTRCVQLLLSQTPKVRRGTDIQERQTKGEREEQAKRHVGNILTDRQRDQHIGNWYADRQAVCLLVGCVASQQHASVFQVRICSDNFTCCYTEIEVADQTFYLTQSKYTDTGPTSPSADPIAPGAWQGSHWSANF